LNIRGDNLISKDHCEISCYAPDKVSRLSNLVEETNTLGVSQIFKALSDDTRVKIAYSLTLETELCVCDVANIVSCTVATASHHLRLLRNMGLAKYRKEGKLVFYSLDDEHVRHLIQIAFDHQEEVEARGQLNR
jgi:ArsR family transcriptional regulator, lead/cadmium/zinc/bismuth-responsive transcriptional repressor